MQNYLQYIKEFHNSNPIELTFVENHLTKHLKDNQENQDEIEQILDFLFSNPTIDISLIGYTTLMEKTIKWHNKLQSVVVKDKEEEWKDYTIFMDFNDGFKIVQLISKESYEREWRLMSHCVSSYYWRDSKIYSLRDLKNLPHATLEYWNQIKGKWNWKIDPKYIDYIVKFLEKTNTTVWENEMKNLGYYKLDKIDSNLTAPSLYNWYIYEWKLDTIKDQYDNTYKWLWFLNIKNFVDFTWYYSFKLSLDISWMTEYFISLFKEIKSTWKSNKENYKIGSSGNYAQIGSSWNYAQIGSSGDSAKIGSSGNYAKIGSSGYSAQIGSSGYPAQIGSSGDSAKIGSSGNYAQIGSSGNYAQIGSSGNYAQIGSSGDSAKIGSSGNYAQIGSSGYSAQIGSSGYSAQIGSSGDSAKIGSSGDSAQIGSSGNSAQIGSSGNYAKIGSSGNYAQIGSSGNYAQIGSSGDSAKIGSSGDSAQIGSSGNSAQISVEWNYSITSAIWNKSKIKWILWTWIILAEYDKNSEWYTYPKNVKCWQIDNISLKENTWYQLINNEFTEVKV